MQSRRIDLEREISIRVPAFDSFITEYSSNVSTTGMFIQSEKPLPPDTQLGFEFKVADDWKLIRGKATVVWSRYHSEGPERPAGMGVLFTEIDPQSRRLIHWIIEKHVREGGVPFDLGQLRDSYDEELVEMAETEKDVGMPPPVTRVMERPKLFVEPPPKKAPPQPAKFRLVPLISAGVIVAAILAGLFWVSEKGAQSAANPDGEALDALVASTGTPTETGAGDAPQVADGAAGSAPAAVDDARDDAQQSDGGDTTESPTVQTTATPPPTAAPTSSADTSADPSPDTVGAAVSRAFDEAAQRVVTSWAGDWSDQNVEAYLSHYASDFEPPNGQSRGDWEAVRAQRLGGPDFIRITVSAMATELDDGTRGRATFLQSYESDRFQDTVRKTLELVREDGRWKILDEQSSPGS